MCVLQSLSKEFHLKPEILVMSITIKHPDFSFFFRHMFACSLYLYLRRIFVDTGIHNLLSTDFPLRALLLIFKIKVVVKLLQVDQYIIFPVPKRTAIVQFSYTPSIIYVLVLHLLTMGLHAFPLSISLSIWL